MPENGVCIPQVSLTRWVHFVGVRGRKLSYTLSERRTAHRAAISAANGGAANSAASATVYLHSGWIPDGRNHTWPYWATGLSTTTSQKGD